MTDNPYPYSHTPFTRRIRDLEANNWFYPKQTKSYIRRYEWQHYLKRTPADRKILLSFVYFFPPSNKIYTFYFFNSNKVVKEKSHGRMIAVKSSSSPYQSILVHIVLWSQFTNNHWLNCNFSFCLPGKVLPSSHSLPSVISSFFSLFISSSLFLSPLASRSVNLQKLEDVIT